MFWDFVKVIAYLAACIFVIWLSMKASKLYAGGGLGRFASTRYIKLLDKMSFGKDSGVGIIQIGEKYMLVSMASGRVDILCELDEKDLIDLRGENSGAAGVYEAVADNFASAAGKLFGKFKKGKQSKKGDFSKLLHQKADNEDIEFYKSAEKKKNDESDSVVDELLESSHKRAEEFRTKHRNR